MKFISNRLVTKSVTLEEALAKAKSPVVARSLDDMLGALDKQNKQVKVAAAAQPVKTAEAKAPEATVKVAEVPESFKEHQFKPKGEKDDGEKKEDKKEDGEKKEEKKDDKPDFLKDKEEKKEDKKDDKKEGCSACAATKAPVVLKIAQSLDFRGWEAPDVVTVWKQHGSIEKCMENVQKLASDPRTYCGLLKAASVEAEKVMVKVASAKAQEPAKKTAATFRKIAKLTDKEKSWLRDYFTNLYGPEYVEALLSDY